MHLVLGQALERYGTASGVECLGLDWDPGTAGLDFLGLSMPLLPHSSAGQACGGVAEELDGVFQL